MKFSTLVKATLTGKSAVRVDAQSAEREVAERRARAAEAHQHSIETIATEAAQPHSRASRGSRGKKTTITDPSRLLAPTGGIDGGVTVLLPSGVVADHPWEALAPVSLLPIYAAMERQLAGRYLEALKASGADRALVAASDEQGRLLNYISPRSASEDKLYYELDTTYYTTLAIKSWPRPSASEAPEPGRIWTILYNYLPEFTVSMHHWRQSGTTAERTLRDMIGRLDIEIDETAKKGASSDLAAMQERKHTLEAQFSAIIQGRRALFHLSAYIRVGGEDLDDLRNRVRDIYRVVRQMRGVSLLQMPGEQRDAFVSSMPYSADPAYMCEVRDASRCAEIFPLITKTHISRDDAGRPDGVLYGLHGANWTPVIMSPWLPDGTQQITGVLGKPGSGKSYWTRCFFGRLAMTGVSLFVIDPLGAYVRWFKNNDGQVIEIAPGRSSHVNPLRRVWDANENAFETIPAKIARLVPLFRILLGDEYSGAAVAIIGGALGRFYEKFGSDEKLMKDFLAFLRAYNELGSSGATFSAEMGRLRDRLVDILELKCLEGDLEDLFAHPTDVDIESSRVYFNLLPSEKGEQRAIAAYLAVTLAIDQAKRSMDRKMIVVDELHELFTAARIAPAIAEMLDDLDRTHRHWNTAVTYITQFFDTGSMDSALHSILTSVNDWVLFMATDQMLDQTIELLGEQADPDLVKSFLKDRGAEKGARRAQKKPMLIYRGGTPIPAYSVGLAFEDAEDDRNAAVRSGSEEE